MNKDTVLERLSILVVVVASIKFLFAGGSFTFFGTADASTYGMFLAPVLGAHGWAKSQKRKEEITDGS